MQKYSNLFSKVDFGKRSLKNRIVLAPMGEGMANPDGSVSEQAIAYYTEFAKGGCAVVTPGVICVDYPYGKPERLVMRIDDPKYVKEMNRMAESVHRYGALFIPQIHHAGAQTDKLMTEGNMPRCVSDIDVEHVLIQPHRAVGPQKEMTVEEIEDLIQKFIQAAVNCKRGKCDGVALHSGHGYLLNQFVSPHLNARTDEYGGSLENRVRFGVSVIKGIREACGPNFIIGVRVPGAEFVPNGLTDDECIEIARQFEAAGCDYLDVSVGATTIFSKITETEKYEQGARVSWAARIKNAVSIPVGAVGNLRDPEFCENLIANHIVDFVILGRTLLCDPYWPKKAKTGKLEEIRPCLSCGDGCLNRILDGLAVGCALNPRTGREFEIGQIYKTETPQKVVVIGGGPGGMQAAIAAASIGHHVTLLEKTNRLGGQFNLASVPPHKEKIAKARDWFASELTRQGVEVKLGVEADLQIIESLKPNVVIAATGAVPVEKIPVDGLEFAVQAWDILSSKVPVPHGINATIVGGGIVACEVAQMLLEKDNNVTILEMLPNIANGLEVVHTLELLAEFEQKKVNVQTNAKVKAIKEKSVEYAVDNTMKTVCSDFTVLAVGQKSYGIELINELECAGYEVISVGDAVRPSKFIDATREGYFAGLSI